MGGGSSSPRTVTVSQNETDVVTISEDVARRLLGRPELQRSKQGGADEQRKVTYKQQSSTSQEDLDFLQSHYKRRVKSLEHQNVQLQQKNDKAFAAAVKEFEDKFLKHKFSEQVCTPMQTAVEKCYAANPGNTLACTQEVRDFRACVQKQREEMFATKG